MAGPISSYAVPFKIVDVGCNGGLAVPVSTFSSFDSVYLMGDGRPAERNGYQCPNGGVRVDVPRTLREILKAAGREPLGDFPLGCGHAEVYLAELGGCPDGQLGHSGNGRFEGYAGFGMVGRVGDMSYVDKLAVITRLQELGIGDEIFSRILRDHPEVILRTGRENPASEFYRRRNPTGHVDCGPWSAYWWGREDPEIALDLVLDRKVTLGGRASPPRSHGRFGVHPVLL